MNAVVKYVVGHTYKPWLEKYLSKKRIYQYNGFRLQIPPEVFHPGFFFSTKFLLKYLERFILQKKSLLELGAGSGLISLHAANKGAAVTATDVNKTAVEYLRINAAENEVQIGILHSDLFEQLPKQQFDFIMINPPYYKKDAVNERELAWFCGSNGEYFHRLFADIGHYMHEQSEVLMVLCDGCDLDMIKGLARQEGFVMNLLCSKKTLIETNFIFNIKRRNITNDITQAPGESSNEDFQRLYYGIRKKEGRIYTDEEVSKLPEMAASHIHAKEWLVRRKSSDRLVKKLAGSKKSYNILEVGCGNGWLSKKLSAIPGSKVTGIDVNQVELQQAKRVFSATKGLQFIEAGPGDNTLRNQFYDVIVFAASIQYFKDLHGTIQWALDQLKAGGQIHIIDTRFYDENELGAAAQRTRAYYSNLGFPQMTNFYFHHSVNTIKNFNYRLVCDPRKLVNRVLRRNMTFPWIMIQHHQ